MTGLADVAQHFAVGPQSARLVDDEMLGDDVHRGQRDQREAAAGGPVPHPGRAPAPVGHGAGRVNGCVGELGDAHHTAPRMWRAA